MHKQLLVSDSYSYKSVLILYLLDLILVFEYLSTSVVSKFSIVKILWMTNFDFTSYWDLFLNRHCTVNGIIL